MNSSTSIRVNNFDLLRLFASVQVAFFHTSTHLRAPIDWPLPLVVLFGEALPGVPMFFVISGFLISASWEKNNSPALYARNRCLRIFPALWVCLGVSIVTAAVFGGVDFLRPEVLPWIAAQLTVVQFYNPAFLREYGVGVLNGSLWTIPVELQFYLLLPVLYFALGLARRQGNGGLLFLTAVSIAINRYFAALGGPQAESLAIKLLGVTLAPYLYMFLLGVLLQRNFSYLGPYLVGRAAIWTALYIAAVAANFALGLPFGGNNLQPVLMLLLAGMVVSWAFTFPTLSERLLTGNDISYGIYIYHIVVVNILVSQGATGSLWWVGVALLVTLAAAWLSWVAVERTVLAMKRNPLHPVAVSGRDA